MSSSWSSSSSCSLTLSSTNGSGGGGDGGIATGLLSDDDDDDDGEGGEGDDESTGDKVGEGTPLNTLVDNGLVLTSDIRGARADGNANCTIITSYRFNDTLSSY
jgi:hypothetical protein